MSSSQNYLEVDQFLKQVTGKITFLEARPGVAQELRAHVEDHAAMAMEAGQSEEAAIHQALRQLGEPEVLGKKLDEIHRPRLDFFVVGIVAFLCLSGLYALRESGWLALQSLWFLLGLGGAGAVYSLSGQRLQNVLIALYPAAILGLWTSQIFGETYKDQNYLSIFGLKINMVESAAIMMALSFSSGLQKLRAIVGKNSFYKPLAFFVTLAPVFGFAMSANFTSAALILVGGLVAMYSLARSKAESALAVIAALIGFGLLGMGARGTFDGSVDSVSALAEAGHTDFILASLVTQSAAFAALVSVFLTMLVIYLVARSQVIKASSLRSTCLTTAAILGLETTLGILTNYGVSPLPRTGINVPFLSYGGSSMVLHMVLIGFALSCLKRKMITYDQTEIFSTLTKD